MRKVLVALVILLLIGGTYAIATRRAARSAERAARISGWLRSDGSRLVDSRGHEIRLATVGIQDLAKGGRGLPSDGECPQQWALPAPSMYANVNDWGFNAVRVSITWSGLEPTPPTLGSDGSLVHTWDRSYLAAIDTVVKGFQDRGVAVILVMHPTQWALNFSQGLNPVRAEQIQQMLSRFPDCQLSGMPRWLYPNAATDGFDQAKCDFFANRTEPGVPLSSIQMGFADAWSLVAQRYQDDPMVIGADMMNEPYPPAFSSNACTSADLRLDEFYHRIGTAIRSVNPNILLVYEDTSAQFARRGVFSLLGPIPFHNAVYSFHLYEKDLASGEAIFEVFAAHAQALGVPIWMGEFDAFGYGIASGVGADPAWRQDTEQLLAHLRDRGASWGFTAYSGGISLIGRDGSPRTDLISALRTGF